MAHFAQLDSQNIVLRVVVIANEECLDDRGVESEQVGIAFCRQLFGQDTNWAQTSYNATFRKHYAGVGYIFDSLLDAFLPPKPYPSWVLNEKYYWTAPVPIPDSEHKYEWDEDTLSWVLISD